MKKGFFILILIKGTIILVVPLIFYGQKKADFMIQRRLCQEEENLSRLTAVSLLARCAILCLVYVKSLVSRVSNCIFLHNG